MHTLPLVVLAAALAAPAPKIPAPKKPNPPDLVGVWVCDTLVYGGKPTPKPDLVWEFTAMGQMRFGKRGIALSEVGTYTVRAAKGPAEFDWDTGDIGVRYWGICKVERDTLTICYVEGRANERPTKFESPAGTKVQFMTFRRVKEDE
jgi:uncharacterized protein (TIGR03067 family)